MATLLSSYSHNGLESRLKYAVYSRFTNCTIVALLVVRVLNLGPLNFSVTYIAFTGIHEKRVVR